MKFVTVAITTLGLALFHSAAGQSGSAPTGYYPQSYSGSAFTGVVMSHDGALTLSYKGKKKAETFNGSFEVPCTGRTAQGIRSFSETDVPLGSELTALYRTKKVEKDGKKDKVNKIIGIVFTKMEGQAIDREKQVVMWCTNERSMQFRAWN